MTEIMPNLILKYFGTLVLLTTLSQADAQTQAISNKLWFQQTPPRGKISAVSNTLYFSSGALGKISKKSNVLFYGREQEQPVEAKPKAEDLVQKQPVEKAKPQAVTKVLVTDEKKTDEGQRSVVTQTPVENLGTEYANSLPKYMALVIGVSQYKYETQGLPSLDNPVRDAERFYKLLTEDYTFEKTTSRLLKNPTRQEIIDALEQLSTELTAKDNLLVFYAGHGYYDKLKEFGFWLPSDARLSTRVEWIQNSTIKDYMTAIPSKHTLLITDACFGGSIFKVRAVDPAMITRIHTLYRDPSKRAMTSGNLTAVPDKSLFIEQILKKLKENEDDYMPSQKLFSRIYEPVTNNSTITPQFGVIQGAGDEGGDFIFIRKVRKTN